MLDASHDTMPPMWAISGSRQLGSEEHVLK